MFLCAAEPPLSKAGGRIVLTALMDLTLGVAARSVSESRWGSGRCTPVKVIIS